MRKQKESDAEKIVKIEQIYIWSPVLRALIDLMNHCREFSKIAAEPKSILITENILRKQFTTRLAELPKITVVLVCPCKRRELDGVSPPPDRIESACYPFLVVAGGTD